MNIRQVLLLPFFYSISITLCAQSSYEPRMGEYKQAGIIAQEEEFKSKSLNGTYIYLIYEGEEASGLIYEQEYPDDKSGSPEEGVVTHRSLLARLKEQGYTKVIGAGEFKFYKSALTEINNRAGTFQHTDVVESKNVLVRFGLPLSPRTVLVDYDIIFDSDMYKRLSCLYKELLKRFPSPSDPELVDYSRLAEASSLIGGKEGDELVILVMRIETLGTSRTLTLEAYSDLEKLEVMVDNMERLVLMNVQEELGKKLKTNIKDTYLKGTVKSDDLEVLVNAAIKKISSKTKIDQEDLNLFVGENGLFRYLVMKAETTRDQNTRHEILYRIFMLKGFFMCSTTSEKHFDVFDQTKEFDMLWNMNYCSKDANSTEAAKYDKINNIKNFKLTIRK